MTVEAVQDLATRYADAWNAHDVDALMSMHAPDSVFHMNIGTPEVRGAEEIRQAFAGLFVVCPDIQFHSRRRYVSENLIVHEYDLEATLTQPLPLGPVTIEPNGERLRFAAVDVIPVANGLVQRKDVYLDAVTAQAQGGVFDR
jgi:hypothetical protein